MHDLGQDIFRIENCFRFLPIDAITCRCSRKEPALLPEFSSTEERRPDSRKQRKSSLLFILLVYSLETAL